MNVTTIANFSDPYPFDASLGKPVVLYAALVVVCMLLAVLCFIVFIRRGVKRDQVKSEHLPTELELRDLLQITKEQKEWYLDTHYRIVRQINRAGEGVMSAVFEIVHIGTNLTLALKMVFHFTQTQPRFASQCTTTPRLQALGAEWREPCELPPHDCLVPLYHRYHAHPLQEYIPPIFREYAAPRTLFLVFPYYPDGSLLSYLRSQPARPPFGKNWDWVSQICHCMLRAVDHLQKKFLVHGDLKPDQFFVTNPQTGHVVLGDFGTVWRTDMDEDHRRLRLGRREEVLEIRGGVGAYKAPELRGRVQVPERELGPLLSDLFGMAETWTVGYIMFEILGATAPGDIFDRLAETNLSFERRRETGEIVDTRGKQPGWVYLDTEIPPLPAGIPQYLGNILTMLVRSDVDRRISAAEAARAIEARRYETGLRALPGE